MQRLEQVHKPSETANKDQASCDIDKDAGHDKKVEDIPDALHVRVQGEDKPICNDFDYKLHQEHEPKCRLGNVEPGSVYVSMLCIVVPVIQGSSDQLDDDCPDDGNEQDKLKDGVGNC